MAHNNTHRFQILIVEDNPKDSHLIQEAFQHIEVNHQLHLVKNGQQALDFLRRNGEYINKPRPNLILMDLNMPQMDGRELLAIIKNDRVLNRIPVVVFSDSENENDIFISYQFQANCYVQKPVKLHDLIDTLDKLAHFWFSIAELPKE